MITVKASREGLLNKPTSSGYMIDKVVPFVALPNTLCLHSFVRITNPLNNKSCIAVVLDVGPWSENDPYRFTHDRPLSESNKRILGGKMSDQKTNGAGIDLGEYVWNALGMKDNTDVSWEFVR